VIYISYVIAGVMSRPDWHDALVETVKLPERSVWHDSNYVYMTVGVIGTTITPWMQFYLQSSIVEKGVTIRQYSATRLDVIVGSFFTDIVAWFIVVVCAATLYTHGMRTINDPADAAQAMKPLADRYAPILFSAGLFNASFFAASILPLSTAYTVAEGLGFESGLDRSFKQAPFFYWFYTLLIVAGAGVVLMPNFPIVKMSILSQVLNGVLLPIVLFFMLRLVNNKELMGKHTNSHWFNVVAWATTVIVVGLSLVMVWQGLHPAVGG
jgi:Mn2+/Fe2+ NRAMP family transporter